MSPRAFDRYMVRVGMGTHPKFARLTDGEFRAHVVGILAIAAMAPIRGCLLVGELEAEPNDIALAAGVSARVARSAVTKLQALGVLYRDEELGCLRVHDWEDINPEPRRDETNAERQRRFRERRLAARNGHSNGTRNAVSNGEVTPTEGARARTSPSSSSSSLTSSNNSNGRDSSSRSRKVDQSQWPDELTADQRSTGEKVLAVLHAVWEERGGTVEPQPRGAGLAMLRNPDAPHVDVARRLAHWLLAGKGQRASTADVAKRFGDWCAEEPKGAAPRAGSGRAVPHNDLDRRRLEAAQRLMSQGASA